MERKIGEIFEYNGEWYQCLEEKTCTCFECVFLDYDCDDINLKETKGSCQSERRNDNKSVVFKKLEKVGEPYEYFVQHEGIVMLQPYKLFAAPIINGVVCNVHYDTNTIDLEIKQTKEDMKEYRMHDAKEDIPEFDKVVDECLFGEDKLNLKSFNLEAAKEGKPVCTRDGRKARIICFDRKFYHDGYNYPIVAMVNDNDNELVHAYTQDGLLVGNKEGELDLMMLSEKKEGWVNVYKGGLLDTKSYPTKKEAFDKACPEGYVDTIKINWSE